MKTLLLMRHAKSAWDDATLADSERPLAGRGKKDAVHIGEYLRAKDVAPDLIVCSPAVRARATAERVAKAAEYEGDLWIDDRIYAAAPSDLLAVIRDLPDWADAVMLVGHNPGFEETSALLGNSHMPFPTAAVACLELPVESWAAVRAGQGALVWLITPKDLP